MLLGRRGLYRPARAGLGHAAPGRAFSRAASRAGLGHAASGRTAAGRAAAGRALVRAALVGVAGGNSPFGQVAVDHRRG